MNPQIAFLLNKSLESLKNSNLDSAELFLTQVIRLQSKNPHALRLLGVISAQRRKYSDAIEYLRNSIESFPNNSLALSNLGNVFLEIREYKKALEAYDKSIKLDPKYHEAWSNMGNVLYELKRYDEALGYHDKALSLRSDYAEAWSNKGNVLNELKRYDEALIHFDKSLSLRPDFVQAWSNKGVTLHELKKYEEALAHFDKALTLKPDYAQAWSNKGSTLNSLKMHSYAAKCYQKALEFTFGDSYLMGMAHHQMMLMCDWTDYEKKINKIFQLVSEGRKGAEPFGFQGIACSEELLKKCSEIYSEDKFPEQGNLSKFPKHKHYKIRIGYLCGEFRNQATSILMTHVWELHDKSRFEIFAFDSGWDDGSEYRERIKNAFDKIFDLSKLSALDAAKFIRSIEIDILINLNGFFGLARQEIFSYRPAPIQVNYLGFPGTIGINYIDYIIADRVVIPEKSKINYVEKVAYLPNSYQANDRKRIISDKVFTRVQVGLPENCIVFACFNNNYKITPSTFDSWSRILKCVRGSILWLLEDNLTAKENLTREAVRRGIDSTRLVFAERMKLPEHLARHNQADLFLDTFPYNAHTTCSDALWAGLPVLTLMGHAFPGRVAASLLNAIGLPELITHTQEEYEALAIELALNPNRLADIKLKLANNRLTAPLFDTPLFTKHIESLYVKMYERYQADLEPEHLSIS